LDGYATTERRRAVALFGHAGRYARLESGINYLRQERRNHRQQVFDELVAYWQELRRQGFWDNLVRLAQSPAVGPPQPLRREDSNGSAPQPVPLRKAEAVGR